MTEPRAKGDPPVADVQDVVDEVSGLLEAPVTLEDRRFRLLAFAAQPDAADPVRTETILGRGASAQTREWFEGFGIAHARGPVRIPANPERGTHPRLCLPAWGRGVVQGYLWAIEPDGVQINAERVHEAEVLAEQAGEIIARLVVTRRETGRLVHELLDATRSTEDAAARALAHDLGVDPATRAVVAIVARRGGAVVPEHLQGWGGLPRRVGVADRDSRSVLVVPVPQERARAEAQAVVEQAVRAVSRHLPADELVVGVGDPAPLAEATRSWEQARAAVAAIGQGSTGPVSAWWSDLGVRRLLGGPAAAEVVSAALTPGVRSLLDAGDPDLVRTARTYLDAAGSVAVTARTLGLHRQSVYARLSRVERVTGLSLADGRDRLELHLGLTLAG
ncbi:helix-turn-helix domain-containing protein [Janibacter sp. Y6]|uniref:PucR family transcriptional regulator n=1 Tax=Janibacter sp. Y6 TaxID=2913552 RepID=UPI0034A1F44D